ncbi:glycosyltransferase family 2 protein [Microbacter margulisiae]|uniref:Glycosyl transferase family 2 n=1 Tax=Microbacter margulisiae TaxID=1350067 RepID=A0A7W5DTE4_9PORP|nr:glycosyltransferase family 2 protein [Microbacter margulisiae]MBB3188408.1 hypothetical protein [Microbacter margulisiae]
MLTTFFTHYNIRFQKKHRLKTLLQLACNMVLCRVWQIKKRILGIHHPVVHLYAVCWNEEKIIPFFLIHYNEFVDHYYIYDNYSDDTTDSLLSAQSNITVLKYDTGGTFNDLAHQQIKNNAWKQSRGKADFVIVCDMDEFLYHPEIKSFLTVHLTNKSIFQPHGFEMISAYYPDATKSITQSVKTGFPSHYFNKMILFDPHRITEINFKPGAHEAYPEGIVKISQYDELKLLHYKNLGIEYMLNRINMYRKRLSQVNRELEMGLQYEHENQAIIEEFQRNLHVAAPVIP